MRVCVYGAGAVGGHIAGRLAVAGVKVSLVVRGDNLAAIREHGLRVQTPEGLLYSQPIATEDPVTLGVQDIVIVTVKAPALPKVAESIAPLLGPGTSVLFVMNGIPWWYFHAHGGGLDGKRLSTIDPGDTVWRNIDPQRAVGAVAHTACTVTGPGVIHVQNPKNRIVFGRPDGSADEKLDALAAAMCAGGLQAEVTSRIRDAVWEKVLMNLVGGSLGILTASTMGEALACPASLAAAERMTQEGAAIAQALGCSVGDPMLGLSRLRVSKHRQSILQDLMAGRAMEVEALLAAPLELARLAEVPTPTCDLIVGLAIQKARAAGLYTKPIR
ncbi:ketopantoate reductase family protein [Variovorax sp. HJSM1_2]|uniref:ketopantoate reductase family protein n=1 Tax=Variovorax sp. HJSM1_2 TaxID=3366263 RepID=UPI003BDE5B4E